MTKYSYFDHIGLTIFGTLTLVKNIYDGEEMVSSVEWVKC